MLIKCFHCGEDFNRKPSEVSTGRNFCSRDCMNIAIKADPSLNPNFRGGGEIPCEVCGTLNYLTPSRQQLSEHHFCSQNCYSIWKSKNMIGENASNFKNAKHKSSCKLCGDPFEYYGDPRFYCSIKCKAESQKKINVLGCDKCQKEFIRRDSYVALAKERGYSHQFCSATCRKNFHVGENHPNWVEDRSCLKLENRRIRYSTRMKEWRISVFERDNYTCLKCGNRSRKGHAVTLNAHHIKRFADFPELRFDVGNGATLCVDCHDEVTGKESEFESMLYEMVSVK